MTDMIARSDHKFLKCLSRHLLGNVISNVWAGFAVAQVVIAVDLHSARQLNA